MQQTCFVNMPMKLCLCAADIRGSQMRFKPSFHIEIGNGRDAAMSRSQGLAFRQTIPVRKQVGFEVSNTVLQRHSYQVCVPPNPNATKRYG